MFEVAPARFCFPPVLRTQVLVPFFQVLGSIVGRSHVILVCARSLVPTTTSCPLPLFLAPLVVGVIIILHPIFRIRSLLTLSRSMLSSLFPPSLSF